MYLCNNLPRERDESTQFGTRYSRVVSRVCLLARDERSHRGRCLGRRLLNFLPTGVSRSGQWVVALDFVPSFGLRFGAWWSRTGNHDSKIGKRFFSLGDQTCGCGMWSLSTYCTVPLNYSVLPPRTIFNFSASRGGECVSCLLDVSIFLMHCTSEENSMAKLGWSTTYGWSMWLLTTIFSITARSRYSASLPVCPYFHVRVRR